MHAYKFIYHGRKKISKGDLLFSHKFRFKTRHKLTYIVDVEEYRYEVFVLKFFIQSHKYSAKKYSLLSGKNDAFKVLSTCVMIIHHVFNQINNNASFGFIGTQLKDESQNNTKRFRVYQKIAKKYFSPETFDHNFNMENSSYLLLNRNSSHPDLKSKAEEMFNRAYSGLIN